MNLIFVNIYIYKKKIIEKTDLSQYQIMIGGIFIKRILFPDYQYHFFLSFFFSIYFNKIDFSKIYITFFYFF